MRSTVVVVLAVVWLFARVSGHTLEGRADVLLVLALVIALFGRRHRETSV